MRKIRRMIVVNDNSNVEMRKGHNETEFVISVVNTH